MKNILVLLLVLAVILIIPVLKTPFVSSAFAQTRIVSPNYEIQFPNFNSGAGVPESANYSLNTTIGKTNGIFQSDGYTIKVGFQYVSTLAPFSFSLSKNAINFGTLKRDTPKTETSDVIIKSGGAGGYTLKIFENHPLQEEKNNNIIDTSCDNGCSETSAGPWTSPAKYGLGFNIWGNDKSSDFISQNDFRQFADLSSGENGSPVITKNTVAYDYPDNLWPWESKATITFKVNVGPMQEAGTYQNTVTFVAMPAF